MMQPQAVLWISLVLLSALVVFAESFSLLYRPAWVWATAPLLTLLVYFAAFSRWTRANEIVLGAASALGALLGWPFIVMARVGSDEDRLPSLFYGLLYFGFFVASALVLISLARKLRANSGRGCRAA